MSNTNIAYEGSTMNDESLLDTPWVDHVAYVESFEDELIAAIDDERAGIVVEDADEEHDVDAFCDEDDSIEVVSDDAEEDALADTDIDVEDLSSHQAQLLAPPTRLENSVVLRYTRFQTVHDRVLRSSHRGRLTDHLTTPVVEEAPSTYIVDDLPEMVGYDVDWEEEYGLEEEAENAYHFELYDLEERYDFGGECDTDQNDGRIYGDDPGSYNCYDCIPTD
jgi:hypothetical protein